MRKPVQVEVGDLVNFRSHGQDLPGKVYSVCDDVVGVQDVWGTPYTVDRISRSLEVYFSAAEIIIAKGGR